MNDSEQNVHSGFSRQFTGKPSNENEHWTVVLNFTLLTKWFDLNIVAKLINLHLPCLLILINIMKTSCIL